MAKLISVQHAGTRWPIYENWHETGGGFEGTAGGLMFSVEAGSLIDPARCASAEDTRAAGWRLVRTKNGVAIVGSYVDSGMQVIVFRVRLDEKAAGLGAEPFPELQATYVLRGVSNELRAEIEAALIEPPPLAGATLDQYGHAAFGPVPVAGHWRLAGETQVLGAFEASGLLVGGGWLVLNDQTECCGMFLQPLPWQRLDRTRVEKHLRETLPGELTETLELRDQAGVWDCVISDNGVSYAGKAVATSTLGAYWVDAFDQVWRVHYWFDVAHHHVEEALSHITHGTHPHLS